MLLVHVHDHDLVAGLVDQLVVAHPLFHDLVLGRLVLSHHGEGVGMDVGLDIDVGRQQERDGQDDDQRE